MYDLPWLRPSTDRLWCAISDRLTVAGLTGVPAALDHDRPLADIWHDPKLLLAQTCGFPLASALSDIVRVVATPCYDLPGCDGPLYCSFILVAADNPARHIADLRGQRAVINGWDSQSGMNALRAVVAPAAATVAKNQRFFRDITVSGAHRRSIAAIVDGTADVAAIDCVTYGLLATHEPDHIARTRILCRSPAVPGLPLVTAAATSDADTAMLFAALDDAMAASDLAETRAALHLCGIARLDIADYQPILALGVAAAAQGYPDLC